jgi:NAD-specific glutamate dehydrogenase
MTDEVAQHVLRDNYEQNVLLGNARAQQLSMCQRARAAHPLARGAR